MLPIGGSSPADGTIGSLGVYAPELSSAMAAAVAIPKPNVGLHLARPSTGSGNSSQASFQDMIGGDRASESADGGAGRGVTGAGGRQYVQGMPENPLELLNKLMEHIRVSASSAQFHEGLARFTY